jgi:hypothetical protein
MKTYQVHDLFFTAWDQLTQKQMLTMLELSEALRTHQPDSTEYGLVLINILRTLRKNHKLVAKLEVEQAVDIFNDINFFVRKADGSFQTPWYFFPVEGFTIHDFYFARPELNGTLPLFNRSFQQLVYADTAFSAFCVLNKQGNNKDAEDAVANLVAVLYTPRELFDVGDMHVRAKNVALKLNQQKQALVLHTYANFRSFITDRYPNMFPLSSGEGRGEADPVFTGTMWMNLRYDLAQTEVFSGFKTASDAGIYDALDYLEREAAKPKPHVQA